MQVTNREKRILEMVEKTKAENEVVAAQPADTRVLYAQGVKDYPRIPALGLFGVLRATLDPCDIQTQRS
jgi:hypothetical protein